jgi:hypothetical protein
MYSSPRARLCGGGRIIGLIKLATPHDGAFAKVRRQRRYCVFHAHDRKLFGKIVLMQLCELRVCVRVCPDAH